MTTRASIPAGAATLAIVALGSLGCALPGQEENGEGQIPRRAADELEATAHTIAEATDNESCEVAHSATTALRRQVDELEGDVELEIYVALGEMVTSIDELLEVECPATGTTSPDEEPEEVEVPVAPTTTPTTTAPEEPEESGEEENGKGPPATPPGHADDGEQKPVPPGQASGGGEEPPTGGLDTERREERNPYSKQAKDGPKPKKDRG